MLLACCCYFRVLVADGAGVRGGDPIQWIGSNLKDIAQSNHPSRSLDICTQPSLRFAIVQAWFV